MGMADIVLNPAMDIGEKRTVKKVILEAEKSYIRVFSGRNPPGATVSDGT